MLHFIIKFRIRILCLMQSFLLGSFCVPNRFHYRFHYLTMINHNVAFYHKIPNKNFMSNAIISIRKFLRT